MRAQAPGRVVAPAPNGGWAASAADPSGGERFRLQATTLGRYLLYARGRDFMAAVPGALPILTQERVGTRAAAHDKGDWRVEDAGGGAFRISLPASNGRVLSASGPGGRLELVAPAAAGDAARFAFEPGDGCAVYPEVEVNAVGTPSAGETPFGEVVASSPERLRAHLRLARLR